MKPCISEVGRCRQKKPPTDPQPNADLHCPRGDMGGEVSPIAKNKRGCRVQRSRTGRAARSPPLGMSLALQAQALPHESETKAADLAPPTAGDPLDPSPLRIPRKANTGSRTTAALYPKLRYNLYVLSMGVSLSRVWGSKCWK
ncbi:hypothetical protein GOP47_0018369, partial [Adiantum capillus-veneris]